MDPVTMVTAGESSPNQRLHNPSPKGRVLDEVAAFLQRFIAFPSEEALHGGHALGCLHTHAIEFVRLDSTSQLAVTEPGSGKTGST